ncbi:MAG: isochorismate synthase [Chloroflexi bacterium]|nr:isochorismate synthase [Chloroflexota bacterium]
MPTSEIFETHLFDWPESDPLSVFATLSGQPRWFWQDSERTLLAWEPLLQLTADSANRFEQMAFRVQSLPLQSQVQPFFIGGFSFDLSPADADWNPFPTELLTLPRFTLLWRASGGTHLLVTVKAGEDPSKAADQARCILARANTPSLRENSCLAADDLMNYAQWQTGVEAIQTEIETGRLSKAVLARARRLQFASAPNPAAMLRRLGETYPDAYCFCFEPQPGRAFVGATPELLARTSGLDLATVALAGSARRDNDPITDADLGSGLMRSTKDRHEHQLVVESIRTALTPLTSTLQIPDQPRLRCLANIQHLESPITGHLQKAGVLPVIGALHPTPALGGLPKDRALALIQAHETVPRGWYGAPVGWMQPNGDGLFAVAIRSALLTGKRARLYAGAGIVAGSDPQREWDETSLKFGPMLQALGEDLS